MTFDDEVQEMVKRFDHASPSALFATQAYAWLSMFYGAVTMAGGMGRWTGPAFLALRQIPGSTATVGVLFFLGGMLTYTGCISGHWRIRNTGIWLLIVLYLAFAGCLVYAAINDPHAPLGGIVIYAGISLQLMVLRRLRGRSAAT